MALLVALDFTRLMVSSYLGFSSPPLQLASPSSSRTSQGLALAPVALDVTKPGNDHAK